jgi:hypothetical protein
MLRKRTRIDIDNESSTYHTEATFPLELDLFPNKQLVWRMMINHW